MVGIWHRHRGGEEHGMCGACDRRWPPNRSCLAERPRHDPFNNVVVRSDTIKMRPMSAWPDMIILLLF
jgi:hypothetical protein